MKAFVLAAIAAVTLTACAQQQCVQPDPLTPANGGCWSQGLDCGTGITNPDNTAK